MNTLLVMAMTGSLLLSLPGSGWSQKEVAPPAVPPILEGERPLEKMEPTEPAVSKKAEEGQAKAKVKGRSGKKAQKKSQQSKLKKKKAKADQKKAGKGKAKKAAKAKQAKLRQPGETPNN